MKTEEAIKMLDVRPWNESEIYKTAISALKKQVPMKMSQLQADLWICPACERQIYGIEGAYCPNCGQAIDWRANDG